MKKLFLDIKGREKKFCVQYVGSSFPKGVGTMEELEPGDYRISSSAGKKYNNISKLARIKYRSGSYIAIKFGTYGYMLYDEDALDIEETAGTGRSSSNRKSSYGKGSSYSKGSSSGKNGYSSNYDITVAFPEEEPSCDELDSYTEEQLEEYENSRFEDPETEDFLDVTYYSRRSDYPPPDNHEVDAECLYWEEEIEGIQKPILIRDGKAFYGRRWFLLETEGEDYVLLEQKNGSCALYHDSDVETAVLRTYDGKDYAAFRKDKEKGIRNLISIEECYGKGSFFSYVKTKGFKGEAESRYSVKSEDLEVINKGYFRKVDPESILLIENTSQHNYGSRYRIEKGESVSQADNYFLVSQGNDDEKELVPYHGSECTLMPLSDLDLYSRGEYFVATRDGRIIDNISKVYSFIHDDIAFAYAVRSSGKAMVYTSETHNIGPYSIFSPIAPDDAILEHKVITSKRASITNLEVGAYADTYYRFTIDGKERIFREEDLAITVDSDADTLEGDNLIVWGNREDRESGILAYRSLDGISSVRCFSNDNPFLKLIFSDGSSIDIADEAMDYGFYEVIEEFEEGSYSLIAEQQAIKDIRNLKLIRMNDQEWYWGDRKEKSRERNVWKKDLVEIHRSCHMEDAVRTKMDYLSTIVHRTGMEVEDKEKDENVNILEISYQKLDFIDERSALRTYLDPENHPPKVYDEPSLILWPNQTNNSQMAAVKKALTNQITIIEGPPGTGKTATITTIIDNLLYQGKHVLVVSNNNSAVLNVQEKYQELLLEIPGISEEDRKLGDFFIASLGRSEIKKGFDRIRHPVPTVIDWLDVKNKEDIIRKDAELVPHFYELKEEMARCITEKHDIEIEMDHFRKQLIALGYLEDAKSMDKVKDEGLLESFTMDTHGLRIEDRDKLFNKMYGTQKVSDIPRASKFSIVWYRKRLKYLEERIDEIRKELEDGESARIEKELGDTSLSCFLSNLMKRFKPTDERTTIAEAYHSPTRFLDDYPVVLSTTFSSRNAVSPDAFWDYVIMDEASQVDLATAALALSAAENAVIVGDSRQLPNVVEEKIRRIAETSMPQGLEEPYDYAMYSFLDSLKLALGEKVPVTLLKEHYRCHPAIIGFCNQMFYEGKLLSMRDYVGYDLDNGLEYYTYSTVLNKPTKVQINQDKRKWLTNSNEAKAITNVLLPHLKEIGGDKPLYRSLGITSPYKDQAAKIRYSIKDHSILCDTVHKFQGKEKDAVFFTTVDDIVQEFADDPNLLNVAVSRAKKKFILVTTTTKQPRNSNVDSLISYIDYLKLKPTGDKSVPVFASLYENYREGNRIEAANLKDEGSKVAITRDESKADKLYRIAEDVIAFFKEEKQHREIGILRKYPLYLMMNSKGGLSRDEEMNFMDTYLNIEILIYNRASRRPILAITTEPSTSVRGRTISTIMDTFPSSKESNSYLM